MIHPMDPRGCKVGGIETHVRLMLAHAPRDWHVVMVGVDGRGDCRLGEVKRLTLEGRQFDFLPVLHYPDVAIHEAARSIFSSITFQFTLGLFRHFFQIMNAVPKPATVELQRFEFAIFAYLLGRHTVQVIHGEGTKEDKMDSLIKKFWILHRFNEEVAIRLAGYIIGVNPNILVRLEKQNPRAARRAVFMPVSVDADIFKPSDFFIQDGVFKIVFAGRLDEFKDPPLMFRTLRLVHERLKGAFEFHYIGTTDPRRYQEFQLVEGFTIQHGFREPREVAAIMAKCHAGILTSHFEGMPCYLLEMLSSGRPVVAVHLPQYELVIKEGQSGFLVNRGNDQQDLIARLAERLLMVWSGVRKGTTSPAAANAQVAPYSVRAQLAGHFARHQRLI
jgi:glycosyltransferase involved in cell wall biosynthesis